MVVALEEKLRVMEAEKHALEIRVKEMAEKVKRVEARETKARQFLLSWCHEGNDFVSNASSITSINTVSKAVKTATDHTISNVDS